MNKRVAMVAVAVLAVVGAGVPASPAGSSGGAAPDRRQPSVEGRYAVGVRTETFVDRSRPTDANGSYAGAPERTLVTTVWYPTPGEPGGPEVLDGPAIGGRRFPLLVWAHGFTASGPAYGLLLRRLASAGYVVAAPTFPLSSGGAPGGPRLVDYVHQPSDVSFVIDEMLRLDADPASHWGSVLWRRRVAAGGHSLGAITTLGLLNSCCGDPRIDAYLPASGIELPFPNGAYPADRRAPILLVHGDADETVPFGGSLRAFATAAGPKYLLNLLGGSHVPFDGPRAAPIVATMLHFLDRYLKEVPGSIRGMVRDGNVPGVARLDRGQ
jgi:fermentation-respiration switch protein FrsA (DUF1100 family)